jgi:NADH-quinone oxidoreductase subunit L
VELMELAWLVPVLPLVSAVLIAAFGKVMPLQGSEIGIAGVAGAFLVSVGLAWHTFTNAPVEALERTVDWAPLGDGFQLELGMLVDGLTAMMFLLVTTVSLMVQIYSREYMKGEDRFTYFYAMLSLFTFSMLLLVIANNTLQAVVGWELVGLCSYLLIGFYWEEKSNQDAANKAFMITKFADVGLIVGVIVLSSAMFDLTDTPFNIPLTVDAAVAGDLSQTKIVLGCLMIFLGAVGKSGQMPLHVWLPDAMAGPTPVSALIHAATMVTAGVFFVARLYPIFAQSVAVMNTIAIVGVITLFLAGFVALVQDDIKKVLAYSTVSQLGYMMAALGVGGYTAGIFHLFTHGFFKALLFLGSGSLIHAVHSNNMSDMGGMRRYMPHTFWTFIVGSLALAGFPLTAGFFSKDEILVSGGLWADQGFVTGDLVFYVGLAGAFVTTFYMARSVLLIFFGAHRGVHTAHAPATHDEHDETHVVQHAVEAEDSHGGHQTVPHESGRQILVPLMVLAVLSVVAGFPGSPFWPSEEHNFEQWTATAALEQATYPFLAGDHGAEGEHADAADAADAAHAAGGDDAALHGDGVLAGGLLAAEPDAGGHSAAVLHGPPHFDAALATTAFVVFLAAVALAYRIYGRGQPDRDPTLHMGAATTVLENKYYLDDLGFRYVVVPVRDRLATWASWTSNEVIDRAVKSAGGATKRAAFTTYRTLDQKVIDGGVNGAAFSAAWWSDKLKRIQSGNVQRYAGALIAGVIVLVLVFAAAR